MKELTKRIIIFLIRKRLGLKTGQPFRFDNQKSKIEYYWFAETMILKMNEDGIVEYSHVALNWLLDDKCRIHSVT